MVPARGWNWRASRFWDKTLIRILCILLLLAVGPGSAAAGEEEKKLLEKIGVESVEKTYQGQKVVVDFSRVTPRASKLTIIHQLGGLERREYHSSRSVVVIDGNYFYQYHPARNLIVKRKLPGDGGYEALRRENLELTLKSYSFHTEPAEQIAGRETRLFEFSPLQEGSRPRRKVWVDTETGLVLKMEIFSAENKLFLMSFFEDIDYRPEVSPASFSVPNPTGVRVVESTEGRCLEAENARAVADLPVELPAYVPQGFVRKCIRAKKSRDYGEVQILYTDGLSLLSVFGSSRFRGAGTKDSEAAEEVAVGDAEAKLNRHGLLRALSWQSPWAHMTILGEISKEELIKVAESITPARELSRP